MPLQCETEEPFWLNQHQ